jgi:hypothetical protein
MTKYKVGDKVIVKEDLDVDACYNDIAFVSDMVEYRGRVVTIEKVVGVCSYYIKEDYNMFKWSDEMFVEEKGGKWLK